MCHIPFYEDYIVPFIRTYLQLVISHFSLKGILFHYEKHLTFNNHSNRQIFYSLLPSSFPLSFPSFFSPFLQLFINFSFYKIILKTVATFYFSFGKGKSIHLVSLQDRKMILCSQYRPSVYTTFVFLLKGKYFHSCYDY